MKLCEEQLKKYVEEIMPVRIKKVSETDHIIHGYMIYRCESCGEVYIMNLEKGLEDPTDDAKTGRHKPVPFAFNCVNCGGVAFHILHSSTASSLGQNYRSYNGMIRNHLKYLWVFKNLFWNDPESDCGVPVIVEMDFSSTYYEDPPKGLEETHTTYLHFDESFDHESLENLIPDPSEIDVSEREGNREQRRHGFLGKGKQYERPRSNKRICHY